MSRGLKQSVSKNRTLGERFEEHCDYRRIYFRLALRARADYLMGNFCEERKLGGSCVAGRKPKRRVLNRLLFILVNVYKKETAWARVLRGSLAVELIVFNLNEKQKS